MQLTAVLKSLTFAPILPAELQFGKNIVFDLHSSSSPFFGVQNVTQLILITDRLMQQHQAKLGIGRYAEQRFIYDHLNRFSDRQRTVHLGVDLTVPVGTNVMAPLPAKIHSMANHTQVGDYGPTIILQHQVQNIIFYTLFGHLMRDCLTKISIGQSIVAGENFAAVGNHTENGGWPPHLHFQIISDLGEYHDTYPGVCARAEQKYFLQNCPDPNLILQCKYEIA